MITKWNLLFAAWLVALVATLGALFIGEVLGQAPCELCWYQRIAMFPLAWLLGVACFSTAPISPWYTLPLALLGLGIAAFHSLIYFGVISEAIHQCGGGVSCTDQAGMTLIGAVPIPLLSLAAFALITLFLFAATRKPQ